MSHVLLQPDVGQSSSVEQHVTVTFKHSYPDDVSNDPFRYQASAASNISRRSPYLQYLRTARNPGNKRKKAAVYTNFNGDVVSYTSKTAKIKR